MAAFGRSRCWAADSPRVPIGSAAYHEVDSSALAFRLAGQLLASTVGALREGAPVDEAMVIEIMAAW